MASVDKDDKIPSIEGKEEKTKETNVKIVSYNVLSSKLCSPKYHIACAPENLDPVNRLKCLQEKLISPMEQKTIICLQEVSDEWSSHLEKFFKDRNYIVHSSQYSSELGVLIAYPMDKYLLNEDSVNCITVGRYFEKFIERKMDIKTTIMILTIAMTMIINQLFTSFWITISGVVLIASFMYRISHPEIDNWKKAISKQNEVLIVNLTDKKTNFSFYVGTYHMPCAFKNPDVMKIHALTVSKIMEDICKNTPYVLTGDFNITPMSSIYQWLTKGGFYTDNINPSPNFEITRHFQIPPLRSIYAQNRNEPEYTCKSRTKDMNEVFRDTLDYIFVSSEWKFHGVLVIPKDTEPSYPSEKEPSDHFMIGADLCI